MKLKRRQQWQGVVPPGEMQRVVALAVLALMVSHPAPAQVPDIIIPDEFLTEEPPPLDLGEVTESGTPDSETTVVEDVPGDGTGDVPRYVTGIPGEDAGEIVIDDISLEEETLPESEGAVGAGLDWPAVEFTTDYFGYFRDSPGGGDNHFIRGDLKLKFEGRIGEDFVYRVTPQFRQDSGDNGANAFEFRENNNRRPLATFHEASLEWLGGNFQVAAGKQIFNWGVSDAYNPIDDLNPRDFLDVPDNERIGVPSLSVYHLHELFEFQAVWVPWFTPSRLPVPGVDNRWLGDFRALQARASALLGFPVGLRFGGRNLPSDQFDNGEFGARLSSSTLVDGWDLAVTYFRGRLAEGVVVGDLQGATLVATLEYPRYHEIGASVATVVGPWQLHGEGSWHLTDKEALDDDYLEYVVGINRSFSDLPLPGVEEVRLILEYAGQTVTRGMPTGSSSFGSRQFARPFEDAVAANLTLKFSEQTELECSGAYDFADDGSIFEAILRHEINDNLEVAVGTDFLSGPKDSFFGKWNDNDRIFLTLSLVY